MRRFVCKFTFSPKHPLALRKCVNIPETAAIPAGWNKKKVEKVWSLLVNNPKISEALFELQLVYQQKGLETGQDKIPDQRELEKFQATPEAQAKLKELSNVLKEHDVVISDIRDLLAELNKK